MLFNTLAYAKFFVLAFVATWTLTERRANAWLPWLCFAGAAVFGLQPYWTTLLQVLVGATGAYFTWRYVKGLAASELPSWSAALSLSAFHVLSLAWLLQVGFQRNLAQFFLEQGLALSVWQTPSGSLSGVGFGLLGVAVVALGTRAENLRLGLMLGASYVFYARWDYRFVGLIFASSSVDYWLAHRIAACTDPLFKRRWLWLTVVLNLGVLFGFKYLNFGIASANALLHAIGVSHAFPLLAIALPIGISFFTFESMSYVIDVYRGDLAPHRKYLDYLCFVAFFPHLVAGPIVRPRDLLPQLQRVPLFSEERASRALLQIAGGLLKKVAIGDYLALNLVDRVFDNPAQYSSLEVYVAVVGYAIQIYCDFSGYTDIAIGSAALLGIEFPQNFNAPYQARSPQDFWRRWHISLSTWLRDYLYISLGGNRRGEARTLANLFLTMLLGGLWHGASFTFVVWGALHGAALVIGRLWSRRTESTALERACPAWLGQLLTFHFVCATWVFFRAPSFQAASAMFRRLLDASFYSVHLSAALLFVLGIGILSHLVPARWETAVRERFVTSPAWAQGTALFVVCWVLREVASAEAVPFVYFQF